MSNDSSKPFISVVIPSYNAALFLPASLDCVLRQQGLGAAYQLELLLVDDGSTDATADLVKQYPEVRYVFQPNQGPAAARNTGIKQARGQYIAFLDADDQWADTTLLTLLRVFDEEPNLQLVGGQVEYVFAKPELKQHYALERANGRYVHIGSRLYRRAVFDMIGLFDEQFEYSEDLDFYNRIIDAKLAMRTLPQTVLYYYVHGHNISIQKSKITMEVKEVLRKTLQRRREIADKGLAYYER